MPAVSPPATASKRGEAGVAQELGAGEVHQRRPDRRVGDELAAVDVDRRGEAGGQPVGLVAAEVHRADLEQHPGGQPRHLGVGGKLLANIAAPFSRGRASGAASPGRRPRPARRRSRPRPRARQGSRRALQRDAAPRSAAGRRRPGRCRLAKPSSRSSAPSLLEDLREAGERHRRGEDAGAAAGGLLGVLRVRRAVGAEEEAGVAAGGGATQRQPVAARA